MYLPIQGFISSFRLLDVVDILLVAFFLYKMLILIRNTRAVALIKGLIVLGAVTVISSSRFSPARILRLPSFTFSLAGEWASPCKSTSPVSPSVIW